MTKSRPVSSEAMSLVPGERLGPYEIVAPLGTGGMGEVYRARDARLRRDVALKVLHRSLALDAEHMERLGREARTAGALNHPNILIVFDVGTDAGVRYVVSELLEGESLRERLDRGSLPFRKALEYGIQIAQGLGAAHSKGISHRDVKPANVFLTTDGRVKLLDFGLAKLREADTDAKTDDTTADESRPGSIVGTAGYMAPEQVLGWRVDHRADIFALGAVLYEMFTAVRAFQRNSAVETMNAVLKEEPRDLLDLQPDLPLSVVAVVRRCLEKNREERFQSARDLAFHLQQLHEARPSGSGHAIQATRRPGIRWAAVAVTMVVVGTAAFLGRWFRPMPSAAVPAFEQLTFRRARIGGARFASEGKAVVYSEAREGNALDVWRVDSSGGPSPPLLLGHTGSNVLAEREGKLALSRGRRFVLGERFIGTLAEVSISGGSPRDRLQDVEDADWHPAGTQLAVARSTGIRVESWIEYPIGTVLYRTKSGSIRFPRVSPDGRRVAFIEDGSARGLSGRVKVVDSRGQLSDLTDDWDSARGLAWSPNGNEIWFTASNGDTNRALRAVDLAGRQRVILVAAVSLTIWDVAPDGRALLTRDEEQRAIVGVPPGETAERDFSLFDSSGVAALSPDGKWLLGDDRFGVYLRPTDGSLQPRELGTKGMYADDLSRDGNWALATLGNSCRFRKF